MTPTEEIRDRLGLIIQPEVTNGKWQMFDDGSAEIEVLEFLYAFIRLIKPETVLETGTYFGISSSYIAMALRNNGTGKLDAIEWEAKHLQESKEKWGKLGLSNFITEYQMDARQFKPPHNYDFMFLDTEINFRLHELVNLYQYLNQGGYVLIHDMPPNLYQDNFNPDHPEFKHWPMGEIPDKITDWVVDDLLRPMYFNNPRGILGFYKTRADEHKWL